MLHLEGGDVELFEAMVPRGSDFIGRTLKSLDFRKRYQLVVLAINRHGVNLLSKISRLKLRFGDVLLIQGNREHVESLAADGQILLLEEISESRCVLQKGDGHCWLLAYLSSSRSLTSFRCRSPFCWA